MDNEHYDICVLGGGLSGCLISTLAQQRGIKVSLIEKRKFNSSNELLFWETVTNSFFENISKYRIDPASFFKNTDMVIKNNKMISAWGSTKVETYQNNNYYHLNKQYLNDHVRSLLKAQDIKFYETQEVIRFKFIANKWLLNISNEENITCDLVIDATGRNAHFAVRQGVKKVLFDKNYALLQTLDNNILKDCFFIIESAENGWWYSNRSKNVTQSVFISNLDGIKKPNIGLHYDNSLAKTYFIKQGHKFSSNFSVRVKDARTGILSQTYGQNWIATGDSAFTLDPLSGNGNTTIVENNFTVFESIIGFIKTKKIGHLKEIDRINNKIFYTHLVERKKYYALEKRWPNSLFWSNIN